MEQGLVKLLVVTNPGNKQAQGYPFTNLVFELQMAENDEERKRKAHTDIVQALSLQQLRSHEGAQSICKPER